MDRSVTPSHLCLTGRPFMAAPGAPHSRAVSSSVSIPLPMPLFPSTKGTPVKSLSGTSITLGSAAPSVTSAVARTLPSDITPELACLQSDKGHLEKFLELTAKSREEEGIALSHIMMLSDKTKTKLFEALWKEHGYPDQWEYAKITAYSNPFVLKVEAIPLLHADGGSLVLQMSRSLDLQIEEEKARMHIQILVDIERSAGSGASNATLKEKFEKLPVEIRNEFFGLVYRFSPDRRAEDRWGEKALLSNIRLLSSLRDPSKRGLNLIDQMQESIKARSEQKKHNETKARFLALYGTNRYSHFELKKLYESLPPVIQASSEIPKPPFYGRGLRTELYKTFGSHNEGGMTTFRVYAPNAKEVCLAVRPGSRYYAETRMMMKKIPGGAWEIKADIPIGTKYQYLITGADGIVRRKADPYARESLADHFEDDGTPGYKGQRVSVVADTNFAWTDSEAIAKRTTDPDAPANIYEVHVSSWKKTAEGKSLNWRELARELAAYCGDMHYTHVELVGAMDHPDPRSWGYQPTGFFAPNAVMGSVQDFKYFVNYMHSKGIKVLIDWVPGHFAVDDFGLKHFDGTRLYEHADERRSYHHEWGVYSFDFEKRSVRDFLLSSANYWVDELHVDGLRIDAVTSMLHTDVGRKIKESGRLEYLPHHKGKRSHHGALHSDAKTLFRDLNAHLHTKHRGVVTHAEESSAFPHLTAPISMKSPEYRFSTRGLGFDAKWNMGRMTHMLMWYMRNKVEHRNFTDISTAMKLDANERVVDVTTHDETAAGKGSLRGGMHGTEEEKFAQARLWLSRAICAPGMKLTMMGCEIAQQEEWSGRLLRELTREEPGIAAFEWGALSYEPCKQVQQMARELNALYLDHPALSQSGNKGSDFTWIDAKDTTNHVISYHRTSKDGKKKVACIHNFGPNTIKEYEINLPAESYDALNSRIRSIREIFNSDDIRFGGKGNTNTEGSLTLVRDAAGIPVKIKLTLPAYSTIILDEELA